MENLKPLKRFGQNYLQDQNTILKIIDTFNVQPDDTILEIGPGRGALTKFLHNKPKKYFAVEIDKRVIDELKNNFSNVHFINADFLEFNLNQIQSEFTNEIASDKQTESPSIRIIGNIPYNITSPILFKMIENKLLIKDALIMTQYEVAKRIIAKPRTKDYGILSVLMNYFATVELCFKISPNVFYPKPKVDSAIIKIDFQNNKEVEIDDKLFIQVVKASFGNRRKTLKNSLSNSIYKDIDLSKIDFDFTLRAEELSIEEFIELTKKMKKLLSN